MEKKLIAYTVWLPEHQVMHVRKLKNHRGASANFVRNAIEAAIAGNDYDAGYDQAINDAARGVMTSHFDVSVDGVKVKEALAKRILSLLR
jgi:hypothetical protein